MVLAERLLLVYSPTLRGSRNQFAGFWTFQRDVTFRREISYECRISICFVDRIFDSLPVVYVMNIIGRFLVLGLFDLPFLMICTSLRVRLGEAVSSGAPDGTG